MWRRATNTPRPTDIGSTQQNCLRLTIATDDADEAFWAIVHSHTHTPAVPSPTDIALAFYPDALYVLVSLSEGEADPATGEPGIRAWRIVDGRGPRGRPGVNARSAALIALLLGGLAVVAATVFGSNGNMLDALVRPPTIIRAALVGGSAALAVVLLAHGLGRLAAGTADVPGLVRGVRLVFLAVAAAAAGAGWALADALPCSSPSYRRSRTLPPHALPATPPCLASAARQPCGTLAAAGWALADALPLLVALVIAGIDVIETSFLLLVVASGQVSRRR